MKSRIGTCRRVDADAEFSIFHQTFPFLLFFGFHSPLCCKNSLLQGGDKRDCLHIWKLKI